jgi:hypothetical protein
MCARHLQYCLYYIPYMCKEAGHGRHDDCSLIKGIEEKLEVCTLISVADLVSCR